MSGNIVYVMNRDTYKNFEEIMTERANSHENPLDYINSFLALHIALNETYPDGFVAVYDKDVYDELIRRGEGDFE